MRQVLFSCIGTSDPVRGEHDGPMLHILRHYRPESVWLFITPEIRELDERDDRFEKTRAWVFAHWDDYQPVFHYIQSDIGHVHDIDALDIPLHEAVAQVSREVPDAEILINVTSGTPQMQMILSQIAMDMRYRARGVQVNTFEKSSGKAPRTNDKDYDVELELECNEDELPDSENRCAEPKMYALHREFLRRQIISLLDQRDFSAVEKLKDSLPENLRYLVQHLAARNRLGKEASQFAAKVSDLPFRLYAYKTGDREKYNPVCEYYLLMKNLVKSGNCTEFLLHLEPLTLWLQMAMLDRQLQGTGYRIDDFLLWDKDRQEFDPSKLQAILPDLYHHYEQEIAARNWKIEKRDISTILCNILLGFFPDVPEKARQLFAHYDMLKHDRNDLAHKLCAVTDADIKLACGITPEKLLEEIEGTIIACYPACDPVVFSVYEKSIEYIKNNL